jgi:hypothetical protein
VPEHLDDLVDSLAANHSRRGFLARVSGALMVAAGGGAVVKAVVKPGEAGAFHLCGHTFTTGSCPHPTGMPRIDSRGLPLRARDGQPVDDRGRPVDDNGRPVDDDGNLLRDTDGRPLPPEPRTPVCERVQDQRGFRTQVDGAWYRCCGGKVRKLTDCCAHHSKRINGDAALTGYCYRGRKVFCVMFYDTKVPC